MAEAHYYRQGAEMYRIELKPGEEAVFRTIEELAIGIRNGLITPRARIYHNASQKWLPIEFHPHYKRALDMPAAMTSGERPAVAAGSPRAHAPALVPAPVPVAVAVAPAPAPTPTLVFVEIETPEADTDAPDVAVPSPVVALPTITYSEPVRTGIHRPRPLHLGLAAAALLIAGAYVAVSAALPARKTLADQAPAQPAVETPAPAPSTQTMPPDSASASAPTFGGPPAAPAAPKPPITVSIGASPPAPARADTTSIEPPPADVDLSIPSLPQGDSLAPAAATDSNAIRRILRAVGGKGASAAPAQP